LLVTIGRLGTSDGSELLRSDSLVLQSLHLRDGVPQGRRDKMNRKQVVGSIFVLVVLIAAVGYAPIVSPNASVAPPSAPALEAGPPASEDGVCTTNPLPGEDRLLVSADLEEAACSRCPNGSPQCWSDKQCDTLCGGKGLGACVRINSCYKCCSCAL
jgi:hypothetical protein